MQTLSEAQILAAIRTGETFEAVLDDGSLAVRFTDWVPYCCVALHAGHRLRPELARTCLLNDAQRLQQEDPYTDFLIASFPVTLVALDSRYEYDLNRPVEQCIYQNAWGEAVWQRPLTAEQKLLSQEKHRTFYRVLTALHHKLCERFSQVLLFDVHSFNWQVIERPTAAVFNLGTSQLDMRRWSLEVRTLESGLKKMTLANVDVTVARNETFKGKGYLAYYGRQHLAGAPVLPLEIKKVFMDEVEGQPFSLVLEQLQQGMQGAILDTAAHFSHSLQRRRFKRSDLQSSELEPVVREVDRALFRLARGIETLSYVNPTNLHQEKQRFLGRRNYEPRFRYRQLSLDPYDFREQLYRLPVSRITDPGLRRLYRAVVEGYGTKIDLITQVGAEKFLYNSLRYYGEPNRVDLDNARFILHAPKLRVMEKAPPILDGPAVKEAFENAAERFGLGKVNVVLSRKIVARAMVEPGRRTVLINRDITCTPSDLKALIHHELGVHMLTTFNGVVQPLKVLQLGLPGNTKTQEGLAILSEYLCGHMSLERLQMLALRVLAVYYMVKGYSFSRVFEMLRQEYGQSENLAFNLTLRVFRGGGLTKDYLYLRGFSEVLHSYQQRSLSSLFSGKTSLEFIDLLDELIERNIFLPPRLLTEPFATPKGFETGILDYLISGLRPAEEGLGNRTQLQLSA